MAEPTEPKPKVLIHLHVQKCAGTSINTALADRFRGRCLTHGGNPIDFSKLSNKQRDARYDIVFGHYFYGIHSRFNRPCCYFSATRDPLERLCSLFNYVHRRVDHPAHSMLRARLRDLDDIGHEHLDFPFFQNVWKNVFCRVYSGVRKPIDEDTFPTIRRRIVNRCLIGEMLVANLSQITDFLNLIDIHSIPHKNKAVIDDAVNYVPASTTTLKPKTLVFLRRNFCRYDYRLISILQKRYEMGDFTASSFFEAFRAPQIDLNPITL